MWAVLDVKKEVCPQSSISCQLVSVSGSLPLGLVRRGKEKKHLSFQSTRSYWILNLNFSIKTLFRGLSLLGSIFFGIFVCLISPHECIKLYIFILDAREKGSVKDKLYKGRRDMWSRFVCTWVQYKQKQHKYVKQFEIYDLLGWSIAQTV